MNLRKAIEELHIITDNVQLTDNTYREAQAVRTELNIQIEALLTRVVKAKLKAELDVPIDYDSIVADVIALEADIVKKEGDLDLYDIQYLVRAGVKRGVAIGYDRCRKVQAESKLGGVS